MSTKTQTPNLDSLCNTHADVKEARVWAREAHDSINQRHKYSGEPYWTHTEAVADLIALHTGNELLTIVALLHDILEDVAPHNPPFGENYIKARWGLQVLTYVVELTNQFTKEAYPKMNRAERKAKEAERLAKILPASKTVKLADIIHNGRDIAKQDPKFAITYREELRQKFEHLFAPEVKGNVGLHDLAAEVLEVPMTEERWLRKADASADKLRSLLANYHPASQGRPKPKMKITAPGAEAACANIRAVDAKEAGLVLTPVERFNKVLRERNVGGVYGLLSSAWFGVPESTECWGIEGFREAVDLMDELPQQDAPESED